MSFGNFIVIYAFVRTRNLLSEISVRNLLSLLTLESALIYGFVLEE